MRINSHSSSQEMKTKLSVMIWHFATCVILLIHDKKVLLSIKMKSKLLDKVSNLNNSMVLLNKSYPLRVCTKFFMKRTGYQKSFLRHLKTSLFHQKSSALKSLSVKLDKTTIVISHFHHHKTLKFHKTSHSSSVLQQATISAISLSFATNVKLR